MKHSKELLASELNLFCDFFDVDLKKFNDKMINTFLQGYRKKYNFLYSELEQIEDDLRKLLKTKINN